MGSLRHSILMSKVAFLFPGQGSQSISMGAHLFEQAAPVFGEASDVLGWDLIQLCKEGPEDKLRQTKFAQPALYVVAYASFVALRDRRGVPEDPTYAVAGHSIGE